MKKIAALILCAGLAILTLTACFPGASVDEMNITSETGAGSRTVVMRLYKDASTDPDGKPVAGMFTPNGNGKCLFPSGIGAVKDLLTQKKPSAVPAFTMTEKTDYYEFSYTFTFTDIADFNAKCKEIAGSNWGTTAEAKLEKKTDKIVYTESQDLFMALNLWAAQAIMDANADVFDAEFAEAEYSITQPSDLLQHEGMTINLLGKSVAIARKPAAAVTADKVITAVESTDSQSAVSSAAPAPVSSKTPEKNPATGNSGILLFVAALSVVAALGAASLVLVRGNKKFSENA